MPHRSKKILISIIAAAILAGCASSQKSMQEAKISFVQQNYGEAFYQLSKAASYNNPKADYNLGYMYYYGLGTTKDTATARIWFVKAAKEKYQPAIIALQLLQSKEPNPFSGYQYPAAQTIPALPQQKPILQTRTRIIPLKLFSTKTTKSTKKIVKPTPHSKKIKTISKKTVKQKNSYTLQLFSTSSKQKAMRFIEQRKLHHLAYINSTKKNNRLWYEVWLGQFSNYSQAKHASLQLPRSVSDIKPWVRQK